MIPDLLLNDIRTMIADTFGWEFPSNRRNDLIRGLMATAQDLGIQPASEAILTWLTHTNWNPGTLEILVSHLTIGETYFFREKPGLEHFTGTIIPKILSERRGKNQEIRIWCAGCCTGEEPYTLAVLLHETIPDISQWKITLIASDINPQFLLRARNGHYNQWSFRETPQALKNKYFTTTGKGWKVNDEIQKMVTFLELNLAKDHYPSTTNNLHDFDVIFCRNVLMYFTANQIKRISNRFYRAVNENGWLITSAVEINDDYFSDFTCHHSEKGSFYQKLTLIKPVSSAPLKVTVTHPKMARPKAVVRIKTPEKIDKRLSEQVKKPAKVNHAKDLSINDLNRLVDQGNYQEFLKVYQTMDKKAMWQPEVMMLKIKSLASLGQLTEARQAGEELLSQDSADVRSYYLMASICLDENDPAQAETMLKRALYLDPNHLMSHFLLGNLYNRQGKKQLSERHFRNARTILASYDQNQIVPESEGLTAGRILSMIDMVKS